MNSDSTELRSKLLELDLNNLKEATTLLNEGAQAANVFADAMAGASERLRKLGVKLDERLPELRETVALLERGAEAKERARELES